jgi:hypothetical protein
MLRIVFFEKRVVSIRIFSKIGVGNNLGNFGKTLGNFSRAIIKCQRIFIATNVTIHALRNRTGTNTLKHRNIPEVKKNLKN